MHDHFDSFFLPSLFVSVSLEQERHRAERSGKTEVSYFTLKGHCHAKFTVFRSKLGKSLT